ncbi:MAG: RHS repeat-associated core domain-containing protein, partial [Vicinamibacterales bacterium]
TTSTQAIKERHDFWPFGEEWAPPASPVSVMKFAGKERDTETGFDYFLARYYRANSGRFTSVDPGQAGAHLETPQSWNQYAYAGNNPLRFVDPMGTDYYVNLYGGTPFWMEDRDFERWLRKPELAGPGISFLPGIPQEDGLILSDRGIAGDYQYYTKISRLMLETGNRADALLKASVKEMAFNAALAATGGAAGALRVTGGPAVTMLANLPKKGSLPNLLTNLTGREFVGNLVSNGFKITLQKMGPNGPVTILSNGHKTYKIYTASSTGGLSAEVLNAAGQTLSKVRIGGGF